MTDPRPQKLLEDMRDAAADIVAFTRHKNFDDYLNDKQLRWAVERGFEIIGEALTQLSKIDPSLSQKVSDYRKIISFRNVLIHGYSQVNPSITWRVITNSLPTLQRELEDLLRLM